MYVYKVKVDASACGKFCVLTHQSMEIFELSNKQDYVFYYILYIENIFTCGYIRADFYKSEISENFHRSK